MRLATVQITSAGAGNDEIHYHGVVDLNQYFFTEFEPPSCIKPVVETILSCGIQTKMVSACFSEWRLIHCVIVAPIVKAHVLVVVVELSLLLLLHWK